ncbi:MAG: 4Fe-4S dicluster domain-containing protein [Gemmataceae bacterium]|nr:4Fe-4S dicluster domain-containing protein [Gemmataceae bacterium]
MQQQSNHPGECSNGLAPPKGEPGFGKNLDYDTFMDCVHCGLCLGSCPTYVETGDENDGPRGRIYLWRAVTDGRLPLTPEVRGHLDSCLECRACETACPSGVKYGEIISSYKHDMTRVLPPAPTVNPLQRWMLFNLTPFAGRMRLALWPVRLMQKLGLGWLVRLAGVFLPKSLRLMNEIVPDLEPHYGHLPEVLPAKGTRRARVGLLLGCAQDAFMPQANYATVKVLQENGCEVWIPKGQGCCAALHHHAGLDNEAKKFAAANCQAFSSGLGDGPTKLDAIINNAGGCGPVLKEYGHLLEGTPFALQGKTFGSLVRDVHEFLSDLGPVEPKYPVPLKATYHDACGLSHAQKIRTQPRQLLGLVPGLQLVPLGENEHCCGAAGSYNLTQPEMSQALGERKARNILATKARAIFTANIGCLLQVDRYLREQTPRIWVAHPMEVLWASYSGEFSPKLKAALQPVEKG